MEIRPITESELPLAAALIAEQQADPERHICYLSFTAQDVAGELRELEPLGLDGVLVAADGGNLLGVIGAQWAQDPPRVWWQGPFIFDRALDEDAVADALLTAAQRLLPDTISQQELGPDDRNSLIAALAERSGFQADEASVVLNRPAKDGDGAPADGPDIAPLSDADRGDVAALHDVAFAGTHLTGRDIDQGERRIVLVARGQAHNFLGYVACEAEPDGSGYIDFLAVATESQNRGVGAGLVEAACDALHAAYGCEVVNLTVRESNAPARRLYAKLAFTEERLIRPWRIGFSLGRS